MYMHMRKYSTSSSFQPHRSWSSTTRYLSYVHLKMHICIYIYIYIFVCVCVRVN